MYDSLLDQYDVIFEGKAEPVFYQQLYPARGVRDTQELRDLFGYVQGLKFDLRALEDAKDQLERGVDFEDLWIEDKDDWRRKKYYDEHFESYYFDLLDLFKTLRDARKAGRMGVVAIPSSTKGVENIVTSMIFQVIRNSDDLDLGIEDLTKHFVRTETKEKSHGGGSRAVSENVRTLAFNPPSGAEAYDTIVVIDDVVSSGSSFVAADSVLRQSGFKGTIVNFAYARTMPVEATKQLLHRPAAVEHADEEPIDAVIFDLDQTLVNDPVRIEEFENHPFDYKRVPYTAYPAAHLFKKISLPHAIVSNSGFLRLRKITTDWKLGGELGFKHYEPGELPKGELPENVFMAPVQPDDYKDYPLYKPCPDGVRQAMRHLIPDEDQRKTARVVGLGNTLEDMIAYNAAGVESCLALWGVPEWLRGHAQAQWGCAHSFETIDEFVRWCLARSSKKEASPQTTDANVAPSQGEAGGVKPETAAPAEYGAGVSAEFNAVAPAEPIVAASAEAKAAVPAEPAPSLSALIKSWRAEGDEYARALQGFWAKHGNEILREHGVITKNADGKWTTTELGDEWGIVVSKEQFDEGIGVVLRYPENAARAAESLIMSELLGRPVRGHGRQDVDADEEMPF